MSSLKTRVLILILVLAFAAGMVGNSLSTRWGGPELQLPVTVFILSAVISGITLWLGLQVKKFRSKQRRQDAPQMNPLLAARTAVLAQTVAYTGTLLAGWHIGLLVYQISMLSVRALWSPFWVALLDVLAGAVMLVTGLLVESMCKIPPEDPDDADTGSQTKLTERKSRGYARKSN